MAIPKRRVRSAGTYFVTSRTWQSRTVFMKREACEIFMHNLLDHREAGEYEVHAFVLMRDHFHILLTPGASASLERAVQLIKGGSAHEIRKQLGSRFPIWQRGFSDHRIRDVQDYETHLRYIEQNPVKRRLVESAGDYPWSSASGRFKLDEFPQGLKPMTVSGIVRHG